MDLSADILAQLAGQGGVPKDDLKQLPRWALVALAVRCARRAQPLFGRNWPDAPSEFSDLIEKALRLTEESATHGALHPDLQESADEAAKAASSAANTTGKFACFTAAFAVVEAAHVAGAEDAENAVGFVQATMDACHKSAMFASARLSAFKELEAGAIPTVFREAMTRDFEHLLERARREAWTSTTAVNMASLGPLWPTGTPQGFP